MDKNSGFPLDDMLVDTEVEPRDDWEKKERDRKKKGYNLLAKFIFAGDCSSEDSIAKTIEKFYNTSDVMRSM